jgi:hypothetical protein
MSNQNDEIKVQLSDIIDNYNEETIKEYVADKDLGYVKSLANLLKITYNTVCSFKDSIVQKIIQYDNEEEHREEFNREESVQILKGLEVKLMKIELLVLVLNDVEESRRIQ